ncbi:MAG: acyl carrier protein [Acidobacteria bacterium]|nr:acyl carrier protein [Acidobacteriota bacterium]
MNADDKKHVATEVLAEISGNAKDEIRPEMDLVADLGIDSPKALQLLVALEDRLEIEISDEEAAKLNTVGDIYAFLGAA